MHIHSAMQRHITVAYIQFTQYKDPNVDESAEKSDKFPILDLNYSRISDKSSIFHKSMKSLKFISFAFKGNFETEMGCKTLSTFYERWDGLMFKWNFVDVNLTCALNCNLIQYELFSNKREQKSHALIFSKQHIKITAIVELAVQFNK